MKKTLISVIAGFAALSLAACGSPGTNATNEGEATTSSSTECPTEGPDGKELIEVKVAASPVPHAKILNYLNDSCEAAKAGIKIEVKEFSDYVLPNKVLASGEVDANYFQTWPYLEDQQEANPDDFGNITGGTGIHLEPLGLYSKKVEKVEDLADGATIGIISDPTNQERAVALLASKGLVKVAEGETANVATLKTQPETNPKNFVFKEVEGQQLVRALEDLDAAVINGNYAQAGGLTPADSIAVEDSENNPASNILSWRKDGETEGVKILEKLLHSDAVKKYIEETWADKSVIPSF